ncbi:hypothetical protein LCGC14_1168040 [marine sediment metagenome]|uniref:RNA ligase domain-containing protein n=1 Tax=marine sediment metagenome TaxID=412755 RepID=A0A0F9MDL6_9ZZZZ
MNKYHKIATAWTRDPENNYKTLIEGDWATPEFAYLANSQWWFTEKIDGTNIRIMWDGQLRFGGKTDKAQLPAFLYEKLGEMFNPEMFSEFESVCLYGEGYGAKIQKGGGNYIPDGVSFILFDVRIGDYWLRRDDVYDIATKMGIATAPVMGGGSLMAAVRFAQDGIQSTFGDFAAEGLVMRPAVELLDRAGRRVISKIKSKDFPSD